MFPQLVKRGSSERDGDRSAYGRDLQLKQIRTVREESNQGRVRQLGRALELDAAKIRARLGQANHGVGRQVPGRVFGTVGHVGEVELEGSQAATGAGPSLQESVDDVAMKTQGQQPG